jgi:PAS domain S-box-containing protein
MKDKDVAKARLFQELAELRQRVAELETSETERQRAEEALRESEKKYRTILENIEDGYYEVDLAGNFTFFNNALCRILGYPPDELMGMNNRQYTDDKTAKAVYQTYNEVYRTGKPAKIFGYEIFCKDGTKKSAEVSASLISGPAGEPIGFRGIFRDITERVQAELLQAALYRIAAVANSEVSLDELYRSIHEIIGDLMYAENFYIALYDPKEDLLRLPYFADEVDTYDGPYKPAKGLTEYVIRSGSPLLIDENEHNRFIEQGELELVGAPSQIWLGVPLKSRAGTFGAMVVQHYTDANAYGEREKQVLAFVSEQVAAAIERKQAEEALAHRAQEMAALYETSLEINSQLEISTLLHAIVQRAVELVDAKMGGLFLMLPDGETLELVVSYNEPISHLGTRLRLGEGLSGRVAQTKAPMTVNDYRHWEGRAAVYIDAPFRRVLGVPLKLGDRVVGVINVTDDEKIGTFDEEEIRLVSLFADQAAIALENSRLFQAEREQRTLAETLSEVTLALTSLTRPEAVLDEILRRAQRIVPYSTANIALLQDGILHIAQWQGYEAFGSEKFVSSLAQRLTDHPLDAEAVQSRKPLVIYDTHQEPRWVVFDETAWIRSHLIVPICLGDRVLGLLWLNGDTPGQFTTEDAGRLHPLVNAAAIAIENARLYEATRRQSERLAQTLAVSELLHRGIKLEQVLERIVQGAVRLGFRRAVLNVCQPEDELVTVQAAAGLEAPDLEALMSATYRWSDFQTLMQERFRVSRSYLIRHAELNWAQDFQGIVVVPSIENRGPGFWHPEDALLVPLWGTGGQPVGLLSLDEPADGLLPDLGTIQTLETLANQAAIAIENSRLVEGLEAKVAARTAEIVAEKEKSEAILRSVGDAILMTDPEMRIQYVNDAFTALTGYKAKEVIGQRADLVGARVASEQIKQSIILTLAKGGIWQGEAIGQHKGGHTYDATLTIAPMRDAQGNLMGYVASHQDISQRKELERAQRRFLTNVSHELRTPVANMKLYVQLLQMRRQPEKAEHYIQVLEDQADRLHHLVDDILKITALDSSHGVTAWEPVSLPTIIKDAVTRYQSRAESSALTLTAVPVPPDLPTVRGDQFRLNQALGELVENAVLFTPAGGQVTVEVQTVEENREHWVTISVRDTGSGISPEEQERIFDRFYRGSLAESGHIPGTGLGLSIVKETLHAHGGRVTVESQAGRGSTFKMWLPPE